MNLPPGSNMVHKKSILDALESSREDFLDIIERIPLSEFTNPDVIGGWSLKDCLAHLCRWEAELIKMLWQIKQGRRPSSAHFDKNLSVDEVNAKWHSEYSSRPLDRILEDFHAVREQTIRNVEQFSERELTNPKQFPLLQNKPLSVYIANDSYEHEQQHLNQIKDWIDNIQSSTSSRKEA